MIAGGGGIAGSVIAVLAQLVLQVALWNADVAKLRAGALYYINAVVQHRDQIHDAVGLCGLSRRKRCGDAALQGLILLRQRTNLCGQIVLILIQCFDLRVQVRNFTAADLNSPPKMIVSKSSTSTAMQSTMR